MLSAGPAWGQSAVYVDSANGAVGNPGTQAQPFAQVQTAINNISSGDTIYIGPGTYDEWNIDLPDDKSIIFMGEQYGEVILDANGSPSNPNRRVMEYNQASSIPGNPPNVNLEFHNLVFQNGYGDQFADKGAMNNFNQAGALRLRNDGSNSTTMSVTIADCIFRNNELDLPAALNATTEGGAIFYNGGATNTTTFKVQRCLFYRNKAFQEDNGALGGAIHIRNGPATICYSTFYGNRALVGANADAGDLNVEKRLAGGAICVYNAFQSSAYTSDVHNCIFVRNRTINNSTTVPNGDHFGGAIASTEAGGGPFPTCNVSDCIDTLNDAKIDPVYHQTTNGGNLTNTNPLFADTANNDFSIKAACPVSPAVDAGNTSFCSGVSFNGSAPDLGAIESSASAGGGTANLINGPDTVCANSTRAYSSASPGDWQLLPGIATADSSTLDTSGGSGPFGIVNVTFGPTSGSPYQDTLIINSTGGCLDTLIIQVAPASDLSGPDSLCANTTGSYNVSGSPVSWTLQSDIGSSLSNPGATSNSNQVTAGTPAGGTVNNDTLIVENSGGCRDTIILAIQGNPAISGPAAACADSVQAYSSAIAGDWQLLPGLATADSSTLDTSSGTGPFNNVTVTYGEPPAGPVDDTLIVTTRLGCRDSQIVTLNPSPDPSGPTDVCGGGQQSYSLPGAAASWSLRTSIGSALNLTGSATTSNQVTFGTPAPGTTAEDTILVTRGPGCTDSIFVTVQGPPDISGPQLVCEQSSATFTTNQNSNWTLVSSTGGSIAGSGTNTSSVQVDFGSSTSGGPDDTLKASTTSLGCTAAYPITVKDTPTITGPVSVCANSSGSYTTLNNVSGSWSVASTIGSSTSAPSPSANAVVAYGSVSGTSPVTDTVRITDTDGCVGDTAVTVNPIPALSGPGQVCAGGEGTYTVDLTGGSFGMVHSNSSIDTNAWSATIPGEEMQADFTVDTLNSRTDSVTYTSPAGCATRQAVTVAPKPSISGPARVCASATGVNFASTVGGSWSWGTAQGSITGGPGQNVQVDFNDNNTSSDQSGELYVASSSGCRDTQTVSVRPALSINLPSTNVCSEDTITGITPFRNDVSWRQATGNLNSRIESGQSAMRYIAGATPTERTDTLSVAFDQGPACEATATLTINPFPEISRINSGAPTLCSGDTLQLGVAVASSGQVADWFRGRTALGVQDDTLQVTQGGDYRAVATSGAGCDVEVNYLVNEITTPEASFRPDTAQVINGIAPTEVTFQNTSTNYTGVSWDYGAGDLNRNNPTDLDMPTVRFPREGEFVVTLTARQQGCEDTARRTVRIRVPDIFVSNVITPNGDMRNERMKISYGGVPPARFSLKIYNRWGQRVFSSTDHNRLWDGTFNGGEPVPEGAYIYQLDLTLQNGTQIDKSGSITVLR